MEGSLESTGDAGPDAMRDMELRGQELSGGETGVRLDAAHNKESSHRPKRAMVIDQMKKTTGKDPVERRDIRGHERTGVSVFANFFSWIRRDV